MKISLKAAAGFLILILLSGTLGAQQAGEIRGKVATTEGEALAGIAITARSKKNAPAAEDFSCC